MSSPLLQSLSLTKAVVTPIIARPIKEKQIEAFLCGPVPIRWLQSAGQCGSAGIVVGIILWFYRGLRKSDRVPINLSRAVAFGVSRGTARRALTRLETLGLVKVERARGKKQMVQILKIQPDSKTEF